MENWTLSADQRQLQAWQLLVHLISLLSILLRCSDFSGIQKARPAADHQTATMTFFWCTFGFEKCFVASSWSNHRAGHHWLSYTIHFFIVVTTQLRNGSFLLCRWLFFWQLTRHPLIHHYRLLQMLNDRGMLAVEFFGSFSCSCKRISFDDASPLLSASNGQPLCFSSSALSSPLQNYLNPLHGMFISSSWVRRIVNVVSCLCCFTTHFELKLKNRSKLPSV